MFLRYAAIVLLGIAPGLFLVGPAVFADGPANERMLVLGMAGLVYGALGGLAGYVTTSWKGGLWLSAAGVAIAVLLSDDLTLAVGTVALVVVAACFGAYGGARLRTSRG